MLQQRIKAKLAAVVTGLCFGAAALAPAPPARSDAVPAHPAQAILSSGINYDWWARLEKGPLPLSQAQVEQLAAAGFRHVRVPLNPRTIGFDYAQYAVVDCGQGKSALDQFLKQVVPALRRVDMGLVLTVDGTDDKEAVQRIAADASGRGLERLLECVVKSTRAADPDFAARRIAIGNLNEPRLDAAAWMRLQEAGLAAVARRYPAHFFLATPAFPTRIDNLLALRVLPPPNIGYEFHYYDPYPFTHQGIGAAPPWLRDKVAVQLPRSGIAPAGDCTAIRRETDGTTGCVLCGPRSDDEFCRDYQRTKAPEFGPALVQDRFAAVSRWANGRFVYVGEYGVNKGRAKGTGADDLTRAFWLRTVASGAKAFGFGRSVFEIGCGMAVSRSTACAADQFRRLEPLDLDPAIVEALR